MKLYTQIHQLEHSSFLDRTRPWVILVLFICALSMTANAQNMSINDDGANPDNSAMLDVKSTSKGMLIPRMTEAQRLAIVSPAYGLMVLQSDNSEGIYIYDTAAAGIWRYVIDSIGIANMIAAGGDTLGNHEMTQNLKTNGNFISNDGDNEGLSVAANGSVTATPGTTGPGNVALFTNGDIRTISQGTGIYFTNTAIGITGNNGNTGDMRLLTGTNTRISINAAGNVDINAPSSGDALTVDGIANIDSVRVNNNYGLPTTDGAAGQILQTDGSGNVTWENGAGTPDEMADADNDTKIQVEESNDEDIIRFDIGGTEQWSMVEYRLEQGSGTSLYIGREAGAAITTGGNNQFVGDSAGMAVTTGQFNVFEGPKAGQSMQTGARNVGVGYAALENNTSSHNTAIGENAMSFSTTGTGNVAVGRTALRHNVDGDNNVALGQRAGIIGTTGSRNVYVGNESGHANEGWSNTLLGFQSGKDMVGDSNTAIGSLAGKNANGSHNVFIGNQVGDGAAVSNKLYIDNQTTSTPLVYGDFENDSLKVYGNLSVGDEFSFPSSDGAAGQVLQTDGSGVVTWENGAGTPDEMADADNDTKIQVDEGGGDDDVIRFDMGGTEYFTMDEGRLEVLNTGNSVFIGEGAGSVDDQTANNNVFVGFEAGNANTSGAVNVAVGYEALKFNATSNFNSALGHGALRSTTGDQNTGLGYNALRGNTTGDANTAVGVNALTSNTTNDDNTAVGHDALLFSTGQQNTALGSSAGDANTTGANNLFLGYNTGSANNGDGNVFIGSNTGALATGADNQLWIDNSNTSTPLLYGDFAADSIVVNGQLTLDSAKNGSGYTFPGTDGTIGQILQTDGAGKVSWGPAGNDADWNVSAGTVFNASDAVGIGTATPNEAYRLSLNSLAAGGGGTKGGLFITNSLSGNRRKMGIKSVLSDNGNLAKFGHWSVVSGRVGGNDTLASFYSVIDNNNAADTAYGLYSEFIDNTGENYGVYADGEDWNYFSGNVGIGVSNPSRKLSVLTSGTDYGIEHTNGSISMQTFIATAGVNLGAAIGTTTSHSFHIYTDDQNAAVTLTAANLLGVGLNNTSPTSTLDVNGDADISSDINVGGEVNRTPTGAANMVPIAYGNIQGSNGATLTGSGNFTSSRTSAGQYVIDVTSESLTATNCIVVINTQNSNPRFVGYGAGSGNINIFIRDNASAFTDNNFSFTIYKP